MSRPLRISVFTRDDIRFPSPYIRLVQPLSFLKRPVTVSVDCGFVNGEFVIDGEKWKGADVVIVARGFPTEHTIDLVRRIRSFNKYLVYETDDAIPLIPDHHGKPWYRQAAPYVFECARLASVVTVSTPALGKLFRTCNETVEVIENQLDPRLWTTRLLRERAPRDGRLKIGIVGSRHHAKDFEILSDAVEAVVEKDDSVWVLYGDGASHLAKILPASRCQYVPPNYDYESHPERLANLELDIGLCPLFDDEFNRCKSDIKFLEFSFLGICGIYSKLPPYESSVSHETNGLLCEWSGEAWLESLQSLIADQAFRDQLSRSAYAGVQNRILNRDTNRWNEVLAEFM